MVPPARWRLSSKFNVEVARYHVSSDPDLADAASGTVILNVPHVEAYHNGGNMLFGWADGDLYIGLGDDSPPGSPTNNAHDPSLLLGKMLRINCGSRESNDVYRAAE
jgi:glucose/arabinose dehydrogenase